MIDTEALRKKVIELALRGKITEQLHSDGDAESLHAQIVEEKTKLIEEGKIKKEKPLPEIKTEELPFEIPKNWKWVRVGEIVRVISGTSYAKGDVSKEGIRILRGGNILDSKVSYYYDDVFVPEAYRDSEKQLQRYDVLIVASTGSSAAIGKPGIVETSDSNAQIGAFLRIVRTVNNAISRYVNLFFLSDEYRNRIRYLAKGMNINNIKEKYITEMMFPLPPLAEQRRIIDNVDKAFEQIDNIEMFQQQYKSDLSVLKGKIIDACVRGKLTKQLSEDGDAETLYSQIQEEKTKLIKEGKIKKEKPLPEIDADEIPFEIPKNWKWVRLGDISSKITSGNTPEGGKRSDAYVKQGFCFFREQNIYDDGIHEEGMVYISEELLDTRPNSTVLPKDILLNITGGSIGRCAIIPDNFSKGSINQHILIIRMIDERLRYYIHLCLCSPFMQKYIKGNAVGDKDGFSGGRCKNMLIPLPPALEQERICIKKSAILEQM